MDFEIIKQNWFLTTFWPHFSKYLSERKVKQVGLFYTQFGFLLMDFEIIKQNWFLCSVVSEFQKHCTNFDQFLLWIIQKLKL